MNQIIGPLTMINYLKNLNKEHSITIVLFLYKYNKHYKEKKCLNYEV